MAVTAAELQAVLGVDVGDSEKQLKSFDKSLGAVGGRASRLRRPLSKAASGFKLMGKNMLGFGAAGLALAGLDTGMSTLTDSIIGLNASLEKSELQFTTLMGDSDKAKKHVKSLFDFAKKTPFETEPIIRASKHLQTFGGDALNTTKTLTLLGDASAAVGAEFDEVSMWVGRLYGNLQVGKPVGEATARLQELGLITPKVRIQLEKMQEEGKKSGAIWRYLQSEMGTFSGAMKEQSQTWEGLSSTLTDTLQLTLAEGFRPLFEDGKKGMGELIGFLSAPETQEAITNIAKGAIEMLGVLKDIGSEVLKAIGPALGELLNVGVEVFGWLKANGPAIGRTIGTVWATTANIVGTAFSTAVDIAGQFIRPLIKAGRGLAKWWESHGQGVLDGIATAWDGIATAIAPLLGPIPDWIADFMGKPAEKTAAEKLAEDIVRLGQEFPGAAPPPDMIEDLRKADGYFEGILASVKAEIETPSPLEQALLDIQDAISGFDEDLGATFTDFNTQFDTAFGEDSTGKVSGFAAAFELAMASLGPAANIGAIAASMFMVTFTTPFTIAQSIVQGFVEWVGDTLPDVGEAFGNMVGGIQSIAEGDWVTAMDKFLEAGANIEEALGKTWDAIVDTAETTFENVAADLRRTWTTIDTNITNFLKTIGPEWAEGWAGLKDTVSGWVDDITNLIRSMVTNIIQAWNSLNIGIPAFEFELFGAGEFMGHKWDAWGVSFGGWHPDWDIPVPSWGSSGGGGGSGGALKMATGSWELERDVLASLHKGEMVVPRPFADDLRKAMRGRHEAAHGVMAEPLSGTIEHVHRIDSESARNLRDAGFDDERVAEMLSEAVRDAGMRYRWAG